MESNQLILTLQGGFPIRRTIAALITLIVFALTAVTVHADNHVDPRLQTVLDFIETSDGAHVIKAFEETGASLIYSSISDAAHYRHSDNTIVFDESMSSEPMAVRAFILVHEIWHAVQPWKKRGQECYVGEFRAEMYATFWWMHKYGDAGHPNSANNEWIARFNRLSSLMANDIKHGTNTFRDQVYEAYADVCGTNFDYAAVERLFRYTEVIARRALAAKLGVNSNGATAHLAVRAYARHIDALPLVYVMHVWAMGGTGVSHPLFDVDAFVKAYFADPRKYLQVVDTWLTDYLADPCSTSQEAREWVIANEERQPGTLRAYIRAPVMLESLVTLYVSGIYEQAERDFANNPNRYRCAAQARISVSTSSTHRRS